MKMVLIAPRKYVQGRGVIAEIGSCLAAIGTKPVSLWDATVKGVVGEAVLASCQDAGLTVTEAQFNGESTKAEAARVADIARTAGADIAVGVGGGKILDTAKAAAHLAKIATVTVPTIASNDSPTSSFTVWYDEKHNFCGFESWGRNPDLVLVDTAVIARGPLPAFISGIGDALSSGFDGILLLGCKYGDDYQCHFVRGSELANTRMDNVRDKLSQLVLEEERVQIHTLAINEYEKLPKLLDDFLEEIEEAGPNPYKGF